MADSHKNIVITPNKSVANSLPSIVFTGYENDPMTINVTDGVSGGNKGLDINGSEGQVLNITPELNNGSFFRANDISGLPAIEAKSDGKLLFNQFNQGNVGIGTASPAQKLDVSGGVKADEVTLDKGSSGAMYLKFGDGATYPTSSTIEFNVKPTGVSAKIEYTSAGLYYKTNSSGGSHRFASYIAGASISNADRLTIDNSEGDVIVENTTSSVSTSTGALQVKGGAGIAGDVNIGGDISHHSNRILDSQTVGDLQSGSSYKFDGDEDRVVLPTSVLNRPTHGTITAWVKYDSIGTNASTWVNGGIITKGDVYFSLTNNSSKNLVAYYYNSSNSAISTIASTSVLETGKWYFVTYVWSPTTSLLYLDGLQEYSGTNIGIGYDWNSSSETQTGTCYIGDTSSGTASNGDFDGEIRQLRIHNRVLSASEVAAAYNGQAVPFEYKDDGLSVQGYGVGAERIPSASNRTFASGIGNWSAVSITPTNDSSALKFTQTAAYSVSAPIGSISFGERGYLASSYFADFQIGRRYRLTFDAKATTAGSKLYSCIQGNGSHIAEEAHTLTTSFATYHYEFLIPTNCNPTQYFIFALDAAEAYWLDNVSCVQIGCVAEYLPQSIEGIKWNDASGNNLDGTVSGAIANNDSISVAASPFGYAWSKTVAASDSQRAIGVYQGKDGSGNVVDMRIASIADATQGAIYTFTNHKLTFATNNAAPQMTLDTSGRLKIGSGAPTMTLEVGGQQLISSSSPELDLNNTGAGTNQKRWRHVVNSSGTYTLQTVNDAISDSQVAMSITRPAANINVGDVIFPNGNVGIGVVPENKLHVARGSNWQLTLEHTGASSSTDGWILGQLSDGAFGISAENDAGHAGSPPLRILTSGNVGMGTTAPSQRLHVAGDVKADYLLSTKTINASNNDSVSYKFDGVNDYVIVDDSSQTWHGQDWTYSLWVKTTSNLEQLIELKHDAGANVNNHTGIFLNADGTISCSVYQTSGTSKSITQTNTINDGEWHHLAWSHENTTTNGNVFYIDGVKVNSDTTSLTLSDTYRRMYIGINRNDADNAFNSPFDGQISKVRIFNNALTDDEIKQLYSGASVDYKYVGSNQTDFVVNGTMESALTTGWNVESGLTMAQSSTTRSGGGDSYSANIYGSTASGEEFYQNMTGLTVGKRYRVSAWVFNNSGTQFYSRETYSYAAGYAASDHAHINLPSNNAWTFYEAEFTSANALTQYSFYLSGTVTTGQLLIDDVSITQIGCVAEYLPDGITSSEWTDSSGNDLDGTVTGAVVSGINPIADLASNAMNIAMAVALG